MRAAAALACLVLAGCTHAVSSKTWAKAEEVCASNDGVVWVDATTPLDPGDVVVTDAEVRCVNGATFNVSVRHERKAAP